MPATTPSSRWRQLLRHSGWLVVGESSRRSLLVSVADFRQAGKQPECHRFTASQVNTGRSTDSDLVLDHPSVSKQHARVEWIRKDLVITDLDSRNGVYVNGNRLQQPHTLKGRGGVCRHVRIVLRH